MAQSRIPKSVIRSFKETGHKIIGEKAAAKVGAWPIPVGTDPANELSTERDFRFGLPGNGGHECLQKVKPKEKITYEELLDFYLFMKDDIQLDADNDMKKKLEEAGLPSDDLPQRTIDALWEANKYTDREDEMFRELDEAFGFREPYDDYCSDYERRKDQIDLLQKMMASNVCDFGVTEEVPALKEELQLMFGDNKQTRKVQSVITISLKTKNDMSSWADEVSEEREKKVQEFYRVANIFVELFEDFGEWCDYIDPAEGKPMVAARTGTLVHQTNKNYNDIKCLSVEDHGCCEIIKHAKYGKNVFVGTIVTSMKADNFLFSMLNRKHRISSLPSRAKHLAKWSMLNEYKK